MMSGDVLFDPSTTAYQEGMKAIFANTDTAMGHLWLVTPSNTREDQITSGRDWLRINLAATAQKLALQPLSQPLQEYAEMAEILEVPVGTVMSRLYNARMKLKDVLLKEESANGMR